MTSSARDRLTGFVLLLVAAIWITGVFWTIPEVAGGARVGPRGFPFAMGVMLAALSLTLIVSSYFNGEADTEAAAANGDGRSQSWALLATFGFLGGYVVLLGWFGFLISTAVSIALFLVAVLNKRSPVLVAGLSLGLAFGIWLILGKAMGVCLPRGSLIDWF